jgi:glutamine amidotransferase
VNCVVIDYGAGNIRSVFFALQRLGVEAKLTADPELIRKADGVIFPGVGEASSAMQILRERRLDELIPELKQPVLGICLGMQLLCASSEEGDTKGIGIFPERVMRFCSDRHELKVPQIGWNTIHGFKGPLFEGIPEEVYMYFVHSYFAEIGNDTTAKTEYIQSYSSALCRDNFYAVQFHPEKSSTWGERILHNFLKQCSR